MTFHVGQKVICVDADDHDGAGPTGLVKNKIYTVEAVLPRIGRFFGLRLCETQSNHVTGGFRSVRFRPVVEKKTDISIFTDLLLPTKEFVNG